MLGTVSDTDLLEFLCCASDLLTHRIMDMKVSEGAGLIGSHGRVEENREEE